MRLVTKIKLYGGLLLGLLVLMTIMDGYYTVSDKNGELAILTRFGKYEGTQGPGAHLKLPWVESVSIVTTEMLQISNKDPVNTYTIDNQEVDLTWTVFYSTPASQIEFVFKNVPDQRPKLIALITDRLKVEMGKVNVQDFAAKRGQLRDAIKNVLAHDALAIGVNVTDFQITNADYAKSFRDAVAAAATAKANVETRQQELEQDKINAQRAQVVAKGNADKAREAAAGEADSILLKAKAEAQSIELQGRAEASAIKAKSDALANNPRLVDYTMAQRWDGVAVPSNSFGSNPVPIISLPSPSNQK